VPSQPHNQWVAGALSPRVKRLARATDHSPPCSAEIKNSGAIPPLRTQPLGIELNYLRLGTTLCIVGFEVLTGVVRKRTIFWDITPCIPLKVNRRFGGTYRLHIDLPPAFILICCSSYFSILKMELICSSETLVGF
jgi:hypothetical protein